jgi:hypothetical protein
VSSTLGGWRRRTLTAGLAVAALSIAGLPSATAQNEIPPPDTIVSSPNLKQIANIPASAPLQDPNSVGTDIAFQGDYAFVGHYLGFTIYNIRNPKKPKVVSQVLCPGAQNDISVTENLLFLSTDSRRSDDSCASTAQPDGTKPYWEGMKIFDISDKRAPRYIKSVETDCGSHTHTLVPDNRRGRSDGFEAESADGRHRDRNVYLYVASYAPNATIAKCQPPHDKISIIKVPLRNPTSASVVKAPVLFPEGGNPGLPLPYPDGKSATSGCHDLTVYPEKDLMAGACMGDGVLFDISNREAPRTISSVRDSNFAFWHSATFNNDGTKVVFTDELGGGGAATCNPAIGPIRGADGIYDITGRGDRRKLEFRSYFKINRTQADSENCVSHNGSLIPVRGKDIMVQAWYMGGTWVWDFTDSRNPKIIAFWERGPRADGDGGGHWSSYWYNGYIYGSDFWEGLDVLELKDRRTDSARNVRFDELNTQTQQHFGRR